MTKLNIFIDKIVLLFDFFEVSMNLRREGVIMTPELDLP
jgi:hypothetical protein